MDNNFGNGFHPNPEQDASGINGGVYQQQQNGGVGSNQQAGMYQQLQTGNGADPFQQTGYNAGQYQQMQSGNSADSFQQGVYDANQYQQPGGYGAAPVQSAQPKEKAKVKAIISLVLGILSILMGCCCSYLGIALGIGAIVLAILDRKDNDGKFSGMGLAGLICASVAVVFDLFSIFLVLAGIIDTGWLEDLLDL